MLNFCHFLLSNQSDLELVMETENFYVFKNRAYIPKVFSVDSKICVKDMEEFLELSREVDIKRTLVLINESCKAEGGGEFKELKYWEVSPVKYVVEDDPLRYIVLTEEYHRSWRLSGNEPMKAYGVVNAWEAEKGEGQVIRFERFYKGTVNPAFSTAAPPGQSGYGSVRIYTGLGIGPIGWIYSYYTIRLNVLQSFWTI